MKPGHIENFGPVGPEQMRDAEEFGNRLKIKAQRRERMKVSTDRVRERVARFVNAVEAGDGEHSHLANQAKAAIDTLLEQSGEEE